MTALTRPASPTMTAGSSSTRQTRIRLIAEGVVASYIHDISTRTGTGANQVHHLAARPAPARAALRGHEARPRHLVTAPVAV